MEYEGRCMSFNIPEDQIKVRLDATNRNLEGRFSVLNMDQYEESEVLQNLLSLNKSERPHDFKRLSARPYARTKIFLGHDERLDRTVIIKTPKYRNDDEYSVCDYESEERINQRREMIKVQIQILNDLHSPLLPEPIDYFKIEATDDKLPMTLRREEPVLVLDYQSGRTLHDEISSWNYKKSIEEDNEESNSEEDMRLTLAELRMRLRIIRDVVRFLKVMDSKNYAYQSLNPKHILLLKGMKPRFLGLGSICKTIDGRLDQNHINYRVCDLAYSAPELNNPNISPEYITGRGVSAFSVGVLLHQVIMESNRIDRETIGTYGHFVYPNDMTENTIKNSPLKGRDIHHLIEKLCKENPQERLTDYDEIIEEIESIISTRKKSTSYVLGLEGEVSDKEESVNATLVYVTFNDLEIYHCHEDHQILEPKLLHINFYCKSKNGALGTVTTQGYVCSKCKTCYIQGEGLESIQEQLEVISEKESKEKMLDLQVDVEGQLEPIYIMQRRNPISRFNTVNKVYELETERLTCYNDLSSLFMTKVAVGYYEKADQSKEIKGRIIMELPMCKICNKIYISSKDMEKLIMHLPDKERYEFDIIDNKKLKFVPQISKKDNINYCVKDLCQLQYTFAKLPYYNKENKQEGYVIIKATYCSKCQTYYINSTEEERIRGIKPENTYFKFEDKGRLVKSLIKVEKDQLKCLTDQEPLEKRRIRFYAQNLQKKGHQVLVEGYICKKCERYYITSKEYSRIQTLLPKDFKMTNVQEKKSYKVKEKSVEPGLDKQHTQEEIPLLNEGKNLLNKVSSLLGFFKK